MQTRDEKVGERSGMSTSPKIKRSEKGKKEIVEEPPKEAGKSQKKQFNNLHLEIGFFSEDIELPAFIT